MNTEPTTATEKQAAQMLRMAGIHAEEEVDAVEPEKRKRHPIETGDRSSHGAPRRQQSATEIQIAQMLGRH